MYTEKTRGFTLIELLVVIAIIAILAAILFPVFMTAKRTAVATACLSNCNQIGKAVTIYVDENNGYYPVWSVAAGEGKWLKYCKLWSDLLLPYVKNQAVFTCPARTRDGVGINWGLGTVKQSLGYGIISGAGGTQQNPNVNNMMPKACMVRNSSRKILLGESTQSIGVTATWYLQLAGKVAAMHGGKANYIFCDGHAKALRCTQTISPNFMWNPTDEYPLIVYPFPNGYKSVNSMSEAVTWCQWYLRQEKRRDPSIEI